MAVGRLFFLNLGTFPSQWGASFRSYFQFKWELEDYFLFCKRWEMGRFLGFCQVLLGSVLLCTCLDGIPWWYSAVFSPRRAKFLAQAPAVALFLPFRVCHHGLPGAGWGWADVSCKDGAWFKMFKMCWIMKKLPSPRIVIDVINTRTEHRYAYMIIYIYIYNCTCIHIYIYIEINAEIPPTSETLVE